MEKGPGQSREPSREPRADLAQNHGLTSRRINAADGRDASLGENGAGRHELALHRGCPLLRGRLEDPHPFEGVSGRPRGRCVSW
jgi:hypothetical protein